MHLSKHNLSPDSLSAEPRQEAWRGKERHAQRRPYLLMRNKALEATRCFFKERGFIEVETSILQRSPGNETHIHAFSTKAFSVDGTLKEELYLHTSPEFACKKLLAAGEQKIFTLARSFRNREEGPLHSREFTMLEWYRAGAACEELIEDCDKLIKQIVHACGVKTLSYGNKSADPFISFQVLTLSEAFSAYAGIDLNFVLDKNGCWLFDKLVHEAKRIGVRLAQDDTAGDIFSRILVEKIEPHLGVGQLTFITRYPMAEAGLARVCADDGRFAERFELYACGVELANAFGELTDSKVQRVRFNEAMIEKQRIYGERYPLDEDFLAALFLMPEASGIALGFERLLMLALGAKIISEVMWMS
jgi:lysyl-tRNA synthetase class 2